ncbi:hypothetical protein [Pradoshia sp.]
MKRLSQLLGFMNLAYDGLFPQKKREANRQLFTELSSTILPQMTRIKQTYGFFERELYVIKEHRTKESSKVMDTYALAEQILETVKKYEPYVSPQLLAEYHSIQALELEIQELYARQVNGQGTYHIQLAEFDLKKKKLILVKSFMLFLKKVAKNADVLYSSLEEIMDFYPPFIDHLIENVVIMNQAEKTQKSAFISNR